MCHRVTRWRASPGHAHLVDAQHITHQRRHPHVCRDLVAHRDLDYVTRHQVARGQLLQLAVAQHSGARGLKGVQQIDPDSTSPSGTTTGG